MPESQLNMDLIISASHNSRNLIDPLKRSRQVKKFSKIHGKLIEALSKWLRLGEQYCNTVLVSTRVFQRDFLGYVFSGFCFLQLKIIMEISFFDKEHTKSSRLP